jgi:hypothetical protein
MTTRRLDVVFVAILACASAPTRHASALVVAPPATNNNISAPVDDPGWLNVGDRGIYLGNQWVLTANHVGAGPTVFPGVGTFAAAPGSSVRLHNPTGMGLSADTDLLLFRLMSDPGLPMLSIASSTPAVGATLVLIGDGGAVTPSTAETRWQVTPSSPNFTWSEVTSGGNAHGFEANASMKLWGTNRVENDEALSLTLNPRHTMDPDHTIPVNSGSGDVISMITDFDDPDDALSDPTASEAQALTGDSGSAIFSKENGNWVLAAVTHAIFVFEDQPQLGLSAVYGNLTLGADLASYRHQILSVTAIPEAGALALVGVVAAASGGYATWRRKVRRSAVIRTGESPAARTG